ncbi:MAG: YjbQ family protein [Candidatus Gastranaerophilales bacterium]|nr:YjbQ family protein [Candidatus Gastranaerophilales bacterium]
MAIINEQFTISTSKAGDIIDITSKIIGFVRYSNVENALLSITSSSPYVSILLTDDSAKSMQNVMEILNSIIPNDFLFKNENIEIYNGYLKLKSLLLGHNLNLAVKNNKIQIDDYCKIAVINFNSNASNCSITASLAH